MESNKDFINVDPDYENYNLALKEIEGKDREEEITSDRLYNIIAEEFDTELSSRQRQLEEIEDKIFKAQKLLHLVRYVLVSSYYNKKNLEFTSTQEDSSSIFDAQSRLHPAVKKLLGNNASLDVLAVRGKRKVHNKTNVKNETAEDCQPPSAKKTKLKESSSSNVKQEVNQISLKRTKTKHRILIGNISKWMPSLENDNTTHKWMVYVRGPKEAPDLSHLIEKVIFFLHPSYKPHDVVEVNEYPFHLSRRGWGEFPLRVQMFFKCTSNKPVSIVHNLKLDKTYTGRQMLGNETVVDIFLYDDVHVKSEPESLPTNNQTSFTDSADYGTSHDLDTGIKTETSSEQTVDYYVDEDVVNDIKEEDEVSSYIECPSPAASSFEHDYCHDKKPIKKEDEDEIEMSANMSLSDHTYSLSYSDSSKLPAQNEEKCEESKTQGSNELVLGLDNSYQDNKYKLVGDVPKNKCFITTLTTASGQPIRVLPQSFNRVLLTNGNVVQIKVLKAPQTLVKKNDPHPIVEQRIDVAKYEVTFPEKLFKNVGEVLPYLFKRLPLWSEQANNPRFKTSFPFVAASMQEFLSWNIGKRLNSEWNRARTIRKILCSKDFPGCQKWSTKAIFMYGRSHRYSPLRSEGTLFKLPSTEKDLLATCLSESPTDWTGSIPVNNDTNVDVTEDNSLLPASRDTNTIDISDSSLRHHCTFVKDTALDSGIVLKPEGIAEGVTWNGAERMILEAVKCLAEQLIRRASHHTISREGVSETIDVGVNEMKVAMEERAEIRSIEEYRRRRLVKDFFS